MSDDRDLAILSLQKKLRETEAWAKGLADSVTHHTQVANDKWHEADALRSQLAAFVDRHTALSVASQALYDWYSSEHDMPAEWRVPHVLGLWSNLSAALEAAKEKKR